MLELHVGFLFQGHLLFLFFQRACQYPISSTADGAECYRQTRAFFFFLAEETELLQDDRSGFYLLYLSGSRLRSKTM